MELVELMPVEEWTAMEEELYALCGLNVRVFNREGKHIASHEGWANTLCPLIRSTQEGLMTVCSVAQQNVSAHAQKKQSPVLFECDAGLAKFAVPIFWKEEFLGTVGGCGCLLPDVEVETALLHEITGQEMEELRQAAASVKVMTEEIIEELMGQFQRRLDEALDQLQG